MRLSVSFAVSFAVSLAVSLATSLVLASLSALATPVRAEVPDCATFPGDRAKFACYDNVSRAPKPDPEVKPTTAKAKPATSSRKVGQDR